MGLRDTLKAGARGIAGIAGNMLLDAAEGFDLYKADGPMDEEDQERTPGGDSEDTAEKAPVPTEPATDDPQSLFWDPFAIIEQLGYKEKPSQISYGTLKAMVYRTPVIGSIIQTRVHQVAAFGKPAASRYDLGFRIKLRDSKKTPSQADQDFMQQMQTLIMRTGVTENPRGRDNFKTFLIKTIWDSLVYDQYAFEVVPNRKGQPAEWYAVDAATIRHADMATTYLNEEDSQATKYVQIYDGMVISEYNQEEMCLGIRNPRSDIRLYGYGVSELEMMMKAVTSLLWGWEYNERAFSQGSVHKGILNFKGAIPDKQMRAFRRHWYQMLSGVQNSWRTPITNADDLQWISMHSNNRDMEYNAWMDFLIKICSSFYLMDPSEVNFKYGNTGQRGAMSEESQKEKILESKERGLRPLLEHIASNINQYIIWPINEAFEFEFVGLDARTREEMAQLNATRVKTTKTINELRAEDDEPPLPDGMGDIILDPTFMQVWNQKQAQAQGDEGGGEDDFDFESMLGGDEAPGPQESGKEEPTEKSLVKAVRPHIVTPYSFDIEL